MVTIAITGGIACGKSLVGRYVEELGIPVCEADAVGHRALSLGGEARAAVVREFGAEVVGADGEIDRAVLGAKVFADPGKLERLNALTHPVILRQLREWVLVQPAGTGYAAAIIPLLHEVQDDAHWDVVVCVTSPQADQLRRLAERGLTEAEALARIRAQWDQVRKGESSDYVIHNCGSQELLREQTERVVRSIRGESS
jgi:dephospho-CoA kinase